MIYPEAINAESFQPKIGERCVECMKDLGRGLRIELNNMAKRLGMKFIGFNPTERKVSVELKGKGVTYTLEEFMEKFRKSSMQSGTFG